MKNIQKLLGMSFLFFGSPAFSESLASLPYPYNTVDPVLPFDGHGWYANAEWIEKLILKNNVHSVVEVGSWLGCSARHIASLLPKGGKLYAIDIWEASAEYKEADAWADRVPTLYLQFLSNTIHAGLADKIMPIKSRSLDAVNTLKHFGKHFDLIYIDAAHDTDSVYSDLNAYFPFVKNNSGIMCGDDWSWGSVQVAVINFAKEHDLSIYADHNFWFFAEEGSFGLYSFVAGSNDIWKFPK